MRGRHSGIQPLEPGFRTYAAMPHVSGRTPTVTATVATPHGPVSVAARRDNNAGSVAVTVEAAVAGVVGLRLADEATGCALDLATATLDGRPVVPIAAAAVAVDRAHLAVGETVICAAPPSLFSRCFNSDGGGASAT